MTETPESLPKRILIIARRQREAEDYINVMCYTDPTFKQRARIVSRPSNLAGYQPGSVEVHLIGHYQAHQDWPYIREYLNFHEYERKEVMDWR